MFAPPSNVSSSKSPEPQFHKTMIYLKVYPHECRPNLQTFNGL